MTESINNKNNDNGIKIPPKGLAVLTLVGPSFVWCAEYIGTGEVIPATRTGAILGYSIIWAVVFGIFLKYWIGMCGARYTVCTGEGMIDMFDRIPGPRHCVVWIVLVVQFISATISIGSVASAAGIFMNSLIPTSPYFGGWFVTIFSLLVVWSGIFDLLKIWKSQFRGFLIFFLFTNIVIVFSVGLKPIVIVQLSAILDGLLLTPLQAIWVAIGLYVVMPKLFKDEAQQILRPHWIFAIGLGIAFIVFGYFCIFQIPYIF